jgi:hypothetical protein
MIQVLNNIDPETKLGKMQLAAIAVNDFSDEQFEKMFLEYTVQVDAEAKGLEEVFKILDIVEINRPILYKKICEQIMGS